MKDLEETMPSPMVPDVCSPEIETRVLLLDIARMLQRMEAWMVGQNESPDMIEKPVWSEDFEEARSHGIVSGIVQTSQDSVLLEQYMRGGNSIKHGVMKMKQEFKESMYGLEILTNESKVIPAPENHCMQSHSPRTFGNRKCDPDGYSLSVYTDSMLDLDRTKATEPSQFPTSQQTDISGFPYKISTPNSEPNSPSSPIESRASSEQSWKTASSGRSKATHENAELAFHAYDNWKQGVLSKIRNDSRVT